MEQMGGLNRNPSDQGQVPGAEGGRRQRGQSLVETAIVIPILLLLLAAAIDFGRAFDAYIVLTNAAREGARFATLAYPLKPEDIEQLVYQDVVGSGSNISSLDTFSTTNVVLTYTTNVVTVTLWHEFDLWFGGLIGLEQFHLQKSASMRRAQ